MAYACASKAAVARTQLEKNIRKIMEYLSHSERLDEETRSGLELHLQKFKKQAEDMDFELTNHIRLEMSAEFFSQKPAINRLVSFLAERRLVEAEHWPSVKKALKELKFSTLEAEKTRLTLMAYEEDPVYLIALWLEQRYGKRSALDPVAKKRLEIIRQRVRQGGTHPLTPILLASVPLLFEDPDMSFLKELLAKTSAMTEDEKSRFKMLYSLAMQGKRNELSAIVSKVIDAHSELMTKAKFTVM